MSDKVIPNLNNVVLSALDFLAQQALTPFHYDLPPHTLVIGSGNALPTGRVLFANRNYAFRDEGNYRHYIETIGHPDAAVVISASGEKHAPHIVDDLTDSGISTILATCSQHSTAAQRLAASQVWETPSLPEPLTYNTSTYLGMLLSKTGENAAIIAEHIRVNIAPMVPGIGMYQAYYLLLPQRFETLREMFLTKFDELFGGRVNGRCYTAKQSMHAKTVVPWKKELFVSFGEPNERFGTARLHLPMGPEAGFAAMLAVGYYLVGQIQSEKPAWFIENVEHYDENQKRMFAEAAEL